MRGLYVSYDRAYHYLGTRGFATPGDYNTRVLLLVNGVRLNDNLYDQANIGTDFPIDLDLIERVEFVSGRARRCTGPTPSLAWSTSSRVTGTNCPGPRWRWKRAARAVPRRACRWAPWMPTAATGWWQPPGPRAGRRPLLPKLRRPQQQPRRGPGAGL